MHQPSFEQLAQTQGKMDAAIDAGYENAAHSWRDMALKTIYEYARTHETFTMNDVGAIIRKSPLKTHDNRALGGVIRTAAARGWVVRTGEKTNSRAGHFVQIEIWRSRIYKITT